MKSKSIEKLKASVGGRRSAVAQAAVYAGSAAAAATASGAVVVKSGPVSTPALGGAAVDWDVDGSPGAEFQLQYNTFTSGCGSLKLILASGSAVVAGTGGFNLAEVGLGSSVGFGSGFTTVDPCGAGGVISCLGTSHCLGRFRDLANAGTGGTDGVFGNEVGESYPFSHTGYAGFQFDNGGTPNYGFFKFTLEWDDADLNTGSALTITDWAYDDAGDPITVFALGGAPIPEPSRLGLLALGMCAAGLLRRRKTA